MGGRTKVESMNGRSGAIIYEDECIGFDGTYQGDGTTCAGGFMGYIVEDCDNPFEDISGTGMALFLGDDDYAVVPIGFNFNFYGADHSGTQLSSNGYLTFGADPTDLSNDTIPDPNDPNDFIAPFWDDLNPISGGTIHYETLGTEPDRYFIAQWTDVPQYATGDANTFQAILYEGTNCIEFRYGDFTPEGFPGDYTIGLEDPYGLEGESIDAADLMPGDCVSFCPEYVEPIVCPVYEMGYLDIKPGSCPNPLNPKSWGVLPVALLGFEDFDVMEVDPTTVTLSRADGVGEAVSIPLGDFVMNFNFLNLSMPSMNIESGRIRTFNMAFSVEDGSGISPNEGPPGPHSVYEDVATPFEGELCDCHELGADGFMDLSMKFPIREVADALMLNTASHGDMIELVLTGEFMDGTAFMASDCVRIVGVGGEILLLR